MPESEVEGLDPEPAPRAPASAGEQGRPRPIRLSDRILIAGQTRKGKTELAKMIAFGQMPVRLIAVDPKGEHSFSYPDNDGKRQPVPVSRTPLELARNMHLPIVHWIPASFDRGMLEEGFAVIHETPGPYVLWIDEGSEVSSPSWCPEPLRLTVTQGAVWEKQVILVTQRLAEIHPVFRAQSDHVFLMVPAPILLDLKTLAGSVRREALWLDRELGELHRSHGDYSHLWYCRDVDLMLRCAPIPLGLAGAPLPAPSHQPQGGGESAATDATDDQED